MSLVKASKDGSSEVTNPVRWVEERLGQLQKVVFDEEARSDYLHAFHNNAEKAQKTFNRTYQFWTRSAHIYASYKATQVRTQFVRDEVERERIWEEQHEAAAERVHALCCDLRGFFLKSAQILAKPDLAPKAWVKKLVGLFDQAPATPFSQVQQVVEGELGKPFDQLFDWFDVNPIGSASVAQVHKARIIGDTKSVAVKVQHPGAHELMMTDIRNQKLFARILQKTDLNFDLLSVMDELEEQVEYEFDFVREAYAMDKIRETLAATNGKGKSPVIVPRSIPSLVTRRVLVMEFVEGTPIMQLPDELAKRGIDPNGMLAKRVKRSVLKDLSSAYGQMIVRDGFFHADPHPGNILINEKGKVALLDYGQTKELSNDLRLGYAAVVLGIANGDANEISKAFSQLKIGAKSKANDPEKIKVLAQLMFDTKLPEGWRMASPIADDSILKAISVESFPKDLFFVLRTAQLLRGLSVGMDVPFSCSEQWKPLAEAALAAAQLPPTLDGENSKLERENQPRELYWERRKRLRREGRWQTGRSPKGHRKVR